ncbi:MAG TPA: hypothetical protein VK135_02435 [Candidatus Dormibacteraeota bacterium]|nr:hypothetical protein [Candidatus Dormibacteraeota bacterium]
MLTALFNIIFFFLLRGPRASLLLGMTSFTVLSILGIIFAVNSKKKGFIVLGIILNGLVLVFACFLLLAIGISDS